MALRNPGVLSHEANRAILSLAGMRPIVFANHTATNGADTSYTVQRQDTRRVVFIHLGAGNGDIRFNLDAAATSTSFPILPAKYFSVDAAKNQVLHFWNTTVAGITVYVVEID